MNTGNVANPDLLVLFAEHLDELVAAFETARLLELTVDDLSILDDA